MTTRTATGGFWLSHGLAPLLALLCALLLLQGLHLDLWLARALFYDPGAGAWLGSGSHAWWAQDLLHVGGRNLIRGIVALTLILGFWPPTQGADAALRRRCAFYITVSVGVTVLLVGLLKQLTNTACPWDLSVFGGAQPYIGLFTRRPLDLPAVACFPGGHSSSGFSLVCFYFLWRDQAPRRARRALWLALCVGTLFAFAQEARGAHFLSHDMVSAALAWCVSLAFYRLMGPFRAPAESAARD